MIKNVFSLQNLFSKGELGSRATKKVTHETLINIHL